MVDASVVLMKWKAVEKAEASARQRLMRSHKLVQTLSVGFLSFYERGHTSENNSDGAISFLMFSIKTRNTVFHYQYFSTFTRGFCTLT